MGKPENKENMISSININHDRPGTPNFRPRLSVYQTETIPITTSRSSSFYGYKNFDTPCELTFSHGNSVTRPRMSELRTPTIVGAPPTKPPSGKSILPTSITGTRITDTSYPYLMPLNWHWDARTDFRYCIKYSKGIDFFSSIMKRNGLSLFDRHFNQIEFGNELRSYMDIHRLSTRQCVLKLSESTTHVSDYTFRAIKTGQKAFISKHRCNCLLVITKAVTSGRFLSNEKLCTHRYDEQCHGVLTSHELDFAKRSANHVMEIYRSNNVGVSWTRIEEWSRLFNATYRGNGHCQMSAENLMRFMTLSSRYAFSKYLYLNNMHVKAALKMAEY